MLKLALVPVEGGIVVQPDKILRVLLVVFAACCTGLGPPPAHAQMSDTQVDQMIKATGLPYNTHNKNTWSIDLTRKNIGKVRVILSTGSDIMVIFAILAKKAAINKTPKMMEALLAANHEYDYCKIGLDKDGDMFVRADVLMRLMDTKQLKDVIEQVANASDEVFVKVSGSINTQTSSTGSTPSTSRASPGASSATPARSRAAPGQ